MPDPLGDVLIRRTDPDADGPVDDAAHRPPDIVSFEIGVWEPSDPRDDLYAGRWKRDAHFFRLDIVFAGLVAPPGPLGGDGEFDPFKYGDHPVFGYVEIDMDADVDTGGELDFPELRYNGNAARFGGLPPGARFVDRIAEDHFAFDDDISSPPFVDRSGEEFHIALLGWNIDEVEDEGDGDRVFEAGETWLVEGRLFHRAHGYEPFSFACCEQPLGSYMPEVELRFRHDAAGDRTTISLVYPLTNAGAAQMDGHEEPEPNDGDASNHNSVHEALDDLVFSAANAPPEWRNDPDFVIIADWEFKDPGQFLDPTAWELTLCVATSYTEPDPDGALFVWCDLSPDVRPGDFNADGAVDADDVRLFDAFVALNDGVGGVDEDGAVNGIVDLVDFGPNFSLFDVNYDGVVDRADRPTACDPCDTNCDGDVNALDIEPFIDLLFDGDPPCNTCSGDTNGDGNVNAADIEPFIACLFG